MCAIAGILTLAGTPDGVGRPVDAAELERLRDAMAARGPDGRGLWVDPGGRIGLAHRRLAIIDTGPGGAQPMASADGRLVVVFNGEIYNHRELRDALAADGAVFRSRSDTEVLLHLYDRHGAAMVDHLQGMFAFALWDAARQGLLLARDPFGIKPLYLSRTGGALRFASQAKALAAALPDDGGLDPAAAVGFLLFGFVPEPHSLHRAVRALPAGTTLWADRSGVGEPRPYFSARETLLAADPAAGGGEERRAALRAAVLASVRRHLVADVPVGLFLSAGVDSGALLALAAEIRAGEGEGGGLHTLTLAFEEYRGTPDDESVLAERVAAAYGARHRTRTVTAAEFRADAERVLEAMDQPSTDGVNTWLVAKAAREEGLKVALSGVGGDELLGGYPGFRQIPRLAAALGPFGRAPALGRLFRRVAAPALGRVASPKYAGLLEYGTSVADAYLLRRGLFMPWELPERLDPDLARAGWRELEPRLRFQALTAGVESPRLRITLLETGWYLRNQLLRDADWAGMAHGVEIRTPLVDAALFRDLAPLLRAATPPGKADLLAAARPPLPAAVGERPKTGFGVPLAAWLGRQECRGQGAGPRARALALLRRLAPDALAAGMR